MSSSTASSSSAAPPLPPPSPPPLIFVQTLAKTFYACHPGITPGFNKDRIGQFFAHGIYVDEPISGTLPALQSPFIDTEEVLPKKTIQALRRIMPGLGPLRFGLFWDSQWSKHGCLQAELSPVEYFDLIVALFEANDAGAILHQNNMKVAQKADEWQTELAQNIHNCIQAHISKSAVIQCRLSTMTQVYQLYEIHMYLDRKGNLIDHNRRSWAMGMAETDSIQY